jgi:ribosome-associated protein
MADKKIEITTEFIELNQLLKIAGLAASGGAGKALVAMGGIRVDKKEELRKTAKIRPGQVVQVGDLRLRVVAAKTAGAEPPVG